MQHGNTEKNRIRPVRPAGGDGAGRYLHRLLCVLLCCCFVFAAIPSAGAADIPTGNDIIERIKTTYRESLARSGRSSFNGSCAHYVNYQLLILGINTKYVSGNGNDEYDNYRNLNYSAGGRKIHAYPAASYNLRQALEAISAKSSCVTDILCGFQSTSTTSGRIYGHVFFIHAIIDGYVYFSDSYPIPIAGTVYSEGKPIKCTIEELCAYYGRERFFTLEGVIWFEDEALSAAVTAAGGNTGGNTEATPPTPATTAAPATEPVPETTAAPAVVRTPGVYKISASGGLRLREGPGTDYVRLATIPDGATVIVTEVNGGWGKTCAEGAEGWISLDYAVRQEDLPAVIADTFNASGAVTARVSYGSPGAAVAAAVPSDGGSVRVTLLRSAPLDRTVTVPEGVTLDLGSNTLSAGGYQLIISGGSVTSTARVAAADADPFVGYELSGGVYTYRQKSFPAVSDAELVLAESTAVDISASVTGLANPGGAVCALVCRSADGTVKEYAPLTSSGGVMTFRTDGIPVKYMADDITVYLRVRITAGSVTYERTSNEAVYSVASLAAGLYNAPGSSAARDEYIGALLNYASAAQDYFGYNTDKFGYANSVLPEDKQTVAFEDRYLVPAASAPVVAVTSNAHITAAQLQLTDTAAIRLKMTGGSTGAQYRLLVWSASEYAALTAGAQTSAGGISGLLTAENCGRILSPDGNGFFTLDGITCGEYADTYYFRLCETSGGVDGYDYAVAYSVTEYCRYKLTDGVIESIDYLCRAIATCGAAARAYTD